MLKILSLNAVSVFVKLIASFASMKVITHFIGPSGMAFLGNFRNFTSLVRNASSLGFEAGIVKHIAEYKNHPSKRNDLISTAFVSTLVFSLISIVLVCFFAKQISTYIFESERHADAIQTFGVLLPLYAAHTVFISVLNGRKQFKDYIVVSVLSTLITTSITVVLVWQYHLEGALFALAITESIIVFISFVYVFKKQNIRLHINLKKFSKNALKKLASFSAMTLVSAMLSQFCLLYIRREIIEKFGGAEAGYWETINRISWHYLIFVSSGITLYYLPKLAEQKSKRGFKRQIIVYYKTLIPISVLAFAGIYAFREQLVLFLLSRKYVPVTELFALQLTGDLIKICAMAFSFQFLAKKMLKEYITTEIVFYSVYFTSAMFLMKSHGSKGVLMAYVISYLVYFSLILFIFRGVFRGVFSKTPSPS